MLAYAQLLEQDRLDQGAEVDRVYHSAKLTAAAFNEPDRIWQEHQQVRDAMLNGAEVAPEMTRDEWLARVADIDRRMRRAGLVPPHSGVMN